MIPQDDWPRELFIILFRIADISQVGCGESNSPLAALLTDRDAFKLGGSSPQKKTSPAQIAPGSQEESDC
jgi:hypothetical protein